MPEATTFSAHKWYINQNRSTLDRTTRINNTSTIACIVATEVLPTVRFEDDKASEPKGIVRRSGRVCKKTKQAQGAKTIL
jgi:hypothetical protein